MDSLPITTPRRPVLYGLVILVGLLIMLPRLALLFNAPDAERIADTYIHEVLALGDAFSDDKVGEFIFSVHKYPLLGPYLAVPVVGTYYLYGKLTGAFKAPVDLERLYSGGNHSSDSVPAGIARP